VREAKRQLHRGAAWCALAAACVLVALALAPSARAERFFGVVNPFLNRCGPSQPGNNCLTDRDLQRMSRTGMKLVRWGFRWAVVQPTPGAHNWSSLDQVIGSLANHGIRVMPVMTGTPRWAGRTYGTAPVQSRVARNGWRRFLEASVNRYGPGGDYWTNPALYRSSHPDGPIRPITTWQIWNEPNLRKGAQHVQPGSYVRLMKISHRSIHKADPKAKILLGGMPGYVRTKAWVYLTKLYNHRGFKRTFDAVAVHPYAGDVGPVFIQLRTMRRVMRRHGDGKAPLWITELGWGSDPPAKNQPINKGLKGQKRYLEYVFPLLRQYHKRWHIPHVFWYRWRDPPPNSTGCTFCLSSGLFQHDQKPKPSWRAFKQITRR
jgi:hypothetical protein